MTIVSRLRRMLHLTGAIAALLVVPMLAQSEDWNYSLRPGDNLWNLCQEYSDKNNCWMALAEYNGFAQPQDLQPGTVIKIPFAWLREPPVAAVVAHRVGDVFAYDNSGRSALEIGQQVFIGQRISVAEGYATLQFADGSTLSMYPQSDLLLDSVSAFKQTRPQTVRVSLPRGRVKITVPERAPRTQFRVKTPAAVAAVRGTQFRVDSLNETGEPQMRSEVLEGVVSVRHETDEQDLRAGYGLLAQRGKTLQASQLLEAPAWNYECTDPGYVEWTALDNAASYQLSLLEDNSDVEKVIASTTVQDNNHTFEGLEPDCYRVTVNGTDFQGLNGMESQRRLCLRELPDSPKISSVIRRAGVLTARWSSVESASQYRVEASSTEDFSSLLFQEDVSATSLSLPLGSEFNEVFVRVVALSRDQQPSLYSDVMLMEEKSDHRLLIGGLAVLLAFLLI